MARILINKNWYEQVEPSTFSEGELEDRIIVHAPSVYPEYHVIPFKLTIESDYGKARADLAFIATNYEEWRVVEVEMGHHSFGTHVENQIRCLADGVYDKRVVEYLCNKDRSLEYDRMMPLITGKQPQVLVIVNEPKPEWIKPLAQYNAILAIFELFRADDETEIFRVNGEYPTLYVDTISRCSPHQFAQRFLQVHDPERLNLPLGSKIRIRYNNCMTEWVRLDAEGQVLLKPVSNNPLRASREYDLFRQSDNSLVLRPRTD